MVKQNSLSRSGLEVYKTSDSNQVQTTNNENSNQVETKSNEDTNQVETKNNEDSYSDINFVLHNGEINEISYHTDMYDNSFDYDYEDISSNGELSFHKVNEKRFYKGVKVCLKKAWQEEGKNLKWDDLQTVLMGFIIEQTYSTDKVKLKISAMTKLLEKKEKFDFKQMKRSEIVKSIIEASGLNADINVKGLKDDVIDYTNISSSSSGSGVAGGQGETIDELVKEWVGDETDELSKAKLVHQGLIEYGIHYKYYYNSIYHTPENCLKHAHSGLNCGDTAILTNSCMKSAGLNSYIVLRCDHGHFFTVIPIDGKKHYSDLTDGDSGYAHRAFDDVYQHNFCGNKYDLK